MKNLTPAKMVLLVFIAIGLLIGGFVVKRLMAKEEPVERVRTQMVPLPTGDLEPGTVITDKHIGRGPWTVDELGGDTLLSESVIIGRVVKNPIKAAEPIHGRDLYAPNELPHLPLSEGTRGVTIQIDNPALMLEGWVKPGNHVDVLFTLDDSLQNDPRVKQLGGMSMTLFKGVRILAINRDFVQAPLKESTNSVTLEIDENDVNILRLASQKGELALTLTTDTTGMATVSVENPDRATLEEILKLEPIPEPPAPTPPPKPFVSHIYRSSGHTTMTFGQNGVPSNGNGNTGVDPGPSRSGNWNQFNPSGQGYNRNLRPNGIYNPNGYYGAPNNGAGWGNQQAPAGTVPVAPATPLPGFSNRPVTRR